MKCRVKKRIGDGAYIPSFFVAKVESVEDIENISPISSNILFHEYVHYLQDIYTAYGNYRFLYMKDLIEGMRLDIKSTNTLSPPVNITNQTVLGNRLFFDQFDNWNESDEPRFPIIGFDSSTTRTSTKSWLIDNNKVKYDFGTSVIEESMADILEQRHAKYTSNFEYPYKVIESAFSSKIQRNHSILTTWICFAALNCRSPCEAIYQMHNIYGSHLDNANPSDFWQFLMSNHYRIGFNLNHIRNMRNHTLSSLNTYYNYGPSKMADKIINAMKLMDHSTQAGFIDILKYLARNPSERDAVFVNRTAEIGMPLYYNANNEFATFGSYVSADNEVVCLYALQHIIFLWLEGGEGGEMTCPMINACNHTSCLRKGVCKKKPWRFKKYGKGCPYSIMWKRMGLPDHIE